MRYLAIAGLIFVLLLGIGGAQKGTSHQMSQGSYGHHDWMDECWSDYEGWNGEYADILDNSYLNLSSKQVQQISDLEQKFQKECLQLNQDLQAKRLELRALRLNDQSNVEEINAKLEEISKLDLQLEKKMVEYQSQIHKILTPAQLSELSDDHDMGCCGMRMGWMCW